jgi:hypothetical protein
VIGNDYSVQMIMEGSPRGYQVKLEMKANWEPNWHTVYDEAVSSNSSASYTREARTSGRITYKVTINEFNTNRTGTDEYDVYEEYPDVYEIMGNVGSQMSATWEETKSAASTSGRNEKGFWIYFDTRTGSYEVEDVPDGPVVQCGTQGTINPGSPNGLDAFSSQDYPKPFVCFFHTHTPVTFCSTVVTKYCGPSPADTDWYPELPGICYDYSYSPLNQGHDINLPAQAYPYNSSRRATRIF